MTKAYTLNKKNAGLREVRQGIVSSILIAAGVSAVLLGCTQQCHLEKNPRPQTSTGQAASLTAPNNSQMTAQVSGAQNEALATHTLVFLGDSLTAGYELPASESFPAQVQKTLHEKGRAWKVVNAGVSGDTTAGALARLDWVLRAKPQLMFICLGANDGLRGLKLADTEKNLREILVRTLKVTPQIALAGMLLPTNYGPDYTSEFAALFPKLAREFAIPYLPFLVDKVALVPELTLADGIHPNARGARRVADRVVPFLEPLLDVLEKRSAGAP